MQTTLDGPAVIDAKARYWSIIAIFAISFDMEKTRIAWLRDGENFSKIWLLVLTQYTNVTHSKTDGRPDGQTVYDGIDRSYA